MSVKVMTWVWDHSRSKKSERLVLLAIADCASDDGLNAYPSMAELMRKTGLSERAVQSTIGTLVKLGELWVGRNLGPRGCNRYHVIMATPAESAPPQNLHPAGNAGMQDVHPAPSAPTPQNLHPADPAPPQTVRVTPAESAPGTVLEPSKKNSSTKSSSPRKRGTRIPDDFTVDDDMRTWSVAEAKTARGTAPDMDRWDAWLVRQTDSFRDYWRGRSGVGGVKTDWEATWRNWIRREIDKVAQQPTNGSAVAGYGTNGAQPYVATSQRKIDQVDAAVASVKAKMNGGER